MFAPLRFSVVAVVFAWMAGPRSSHAQCLTWGPGFGQPGLNGVALVEATFDDGTGPALYVGGLFEFADGIKANHIARWDGTNWLPLAAGTNGSVSAMAVFDDGSGPALFAGGSFSQAGGEAANGVARWDGSSWSALGSGLNGTVEALTVYDDGTGAALYVGGSFTQAGGQPALRIAKWNGSIWSALGGGIDCSGCAPIAVLALHVFDDGQGPALFAGGRFNMAGGSLANSIARWNGTSWSTLGSGLFSPVRALASFDPGSGPRLYAGGGLNGLAEWTGSTWVATSGGPNKLVRALAVFDDGSGSALYATGDFTSPGSYIARWNGSAWSTLGGGLTTDGLSDIGHALAVFDDGQGPALYAGGLISAAAGTADYLARWDGLDWSAVHRANPPQGPDYWVDALTTWDDGLGAALYAGGHFDSAGGVAVNHVARWTGSGWTQLGDGIEGGVPWTLGVFADGQGSALYAGGQFTQAGGVFANNIAKWDGTSWSTLGVGIDGAVKAITGFDDGGGALLYAAGYFTIGVSSAPSHIRRWDGSSWNEVGLGLNASTYALIVYDDGSGPALYAGGTFWMAGGQPIQNLARWNGTSWSAVGGGVNNWVYYLAVYDDGSGPALIAGGEFTSAGGIPANRVARWDGVAWSPLGSGLNGVPTALLAFDDGTGPALFAGGPFTTAGGVPALGIARWNGSSWSALGDGVAPQHVNAIATHDDGTGGGADLFIGGTFWTAGDFSSARIAVWRGCGGPGEMYCFGDGIEAACPCGNNGREGHGCQNSASTGGAQLSSSGATNPDSVVLSATGEFSTAFSIFLQGNASIAGVPFGDGIRCAGGSLKRLYTKAAVAGAVSAPTGADPSITAQSAALGDPIASGSNRVYQVYYRDPDSAFCPAPLGSTFNVSNAVSITWGP